MMPRCVSLRLEKMAGLAGGIETSDEPWCGRMPHPPAMSLSGLVQDRGGSVSELLLVLT